jgi:hypothetical protein
MEIREGIHTDTGMQKLKSTIGKKNLVQYSIFSVPTYPPRYMPPPKGTTSVV